MIKPISKPLKCLILFGGTFDPIHNGHLLLATKLYEQFKAPITFLPAAAPPYKAKPLTSNANRLEMLKLALGKDERFMIDTQEIINNTYSCTYQTLQLIRQQVGNQLPIFFLIGGDSLISLDTWDNWQELFNLTNFIVAMRPGYSLANMSPSLKAEFNLRKTTDFNHYYSYGKIYILNFAPINVSSTQIRTRLKNQQLINHLVPAIINEYIIKNQLYR